MNQAISKKYIFNRNERQSLKCQAKFKCDSVSSFKLKESTKFEIKKRLTNDQTNECRENE